MKLKIAAAVAAASLAAGSLALVAPAAGASGSVAAKCGPVHRVHDHVTSAADVAFRHHETLASFVRTQLICAGGNFRPFFAGYLDDGLLYQPMPKGTRYDP